MDYKEALHKIVYLTPVYYVEPDFTQVRNGWVKASDIHGAAQVLRGQMDRFAELEKLCAELLSSLEMCLQIFNDTPALQGRDYVTKGIQVNAAIAKAKSMGVCHE